MKLNLSEKIEIQKPIHEVKSYIENLNKWSEWSPWLIFDKEAQVSVTKENGKDTMSWEGKFVGSGKLTLIETSATTTVFDLQFLKPMRSKAKTSFIFEEKDANSTSVAWTMNSNLPFFLFFLKKLFVKLISKDYIRGLTLMKYMLEKGKKPFTLDFIDVPQQVASFNFYGIRNEGFTYELGTKMSQDFDTLQNIFKNENANICNGYCFYEKAKFLKDWFRFLSGFSSENILKSKGLIKKEIPSHKVIKIVLSGSYDFMETAWTGIMNHQRGLKLKHFKKIAPYEKYIKGPGDTSNPDEYVTEICFPVK